MYLLLKECCCTTRSRVTLKFCYKLSRGSWPRHLAQAVTFSLTADRPGSRFRDLCQSRACLWVSDAIGMAPGTQSGPQPKGRAWTPRSSPVPQNAPVGSGHARLTPAAQVSTASEASTWPTSRERCRTHAPSTDAQMAPLCPPATLGPDAAAAERRDREDEGCRRPAHLPHGALTVPLDTRHAVTTEDRGRSGVTLQQLLSA